MSLSGSTSHSETTDANELEIAREGGLKPIIESAQSDSIELQSQVARALRNLSVNRMYVLFAWNGKLTKLIYSGE